jgi:uncharacterized membrane protein HdeD (DUF308 family)
MTRASLVWGAALILLGLLAVFVPLAAGMGISLMAGWIIFWSGAAYLAYGFAGRDAATFIWQLLIGIVFLAGGGYLVFHPQFSLESLSVAIAVILFLEAVLETAMSVQFRVFAGSGWMLFDAIVTFLLASLIWKFKSAWAIGAILGINLIVSGLTWLMCSIAAHKTQEASC